jgi:hypothetical protein
MKFSMTTRKMWPFNTGGCLKCSLPITNTFLPINANLSTTACNWKNYFSFINKFIILKFCRWLLIKATLSPMKRWPYLIWKEWSYPSDQTTPTKRSPLWSDHSHQRSLLISDHSHQRSSLWSDHSHRRSLLLSGHPS